MAIAEPKACAYWGWILCYSSDFVNHGPEQVRVAQNSHQVFFLYNGHPSDANHSQQLITPAVFRLAEGGNRCAYVKHNRNLNLTGSPHFRILASAKNDFLKINKGV